MKVTGVVAIVAIVTQLCSVDAGEADCKETRKVLKNCLEKGKIQLKQCRVFDIHLRGPDRGGGLHENISEIDFLAVSDRGDRHLSDVFDPVEKILPSRSYR